MALVALSKGLNLVSLDLPALSLAPGDRGKIRDLRSFEPPPGHRVSKQAMGPALR